jgi:hypothetical protein
MFVVSGNGHPNVSRAEAMHSQIIDLLTTFASSFAYRNDLQT